MCQYRANPAVPYDTVLVRVQYISHLLTAAHPCLELPSSKQQLLPGEGPATAYPLGWPVARPVSSQHGPSEGRAWYCLPTCSWIFVNIMLDTYVPWNRLISMEGCTN